MIGFGLVQVRFCCFSMWLWHCWRCGDSSWMHFPFSWHLIVLPKTDTLLHSQSTVSDSQQGANSIELWWLSGTQFYPFLSLCDLLFFATLAALLNLSTVLYHLFTKHSILKFTFSLENSPSFADVDFLSLDDDFDSLKNSEVCANKYFEWFYVAF